MIDTHCHLNSAKDFPDVSTAIAEAAAAGVDRVMVVGVDLEDSKRALDIAEKFESAYAIVGHHPNYAASYSVSELSEFETLLKHPKVVALGEIGLDNHWNYATKEQQMRCLRDQLDLASALSVPVVFHCREAYPEFLDLLESEPKRDMLFHCFAGNKTDAQRAVALGCYFGVDGPVTYKKSLELREIIASIFPRDRVVLETDSPYLSPEPHRGKPNKPAFIPLINDRVAECMGISPKESDALTTANAERFFRL